MTTSAMFPNFPSINKYKIAGKIYSCCNGASCPATINTELYRTSLFCIEYGGLKEQIMQCVSCVLHTHPTHIIHTGITFLSAPYPGSCTMSWCWLHPSKPNICLRLQLLPYPLLHSISYPLLSTHLVVLSCGPWLD
jgi:hypothetical protein